MTATARAEDIAARRNAKIAVMLCSLLQEGRADSPALVNLATLAGEPLIARQLVLIISMDETLRMRFADLLAVAERTLRESAAGEVSRVDAYLQPGAEERAER